MAFPFGAAFAAFLAATAAPGNPAVQGASAVQQPGPAVPLIEPAGLKAMIATGAHFILVDVRRPDEFAAGHIEGAMLMPLEGLPQSFGQLPRDANLVVYCRSGHRSAQAVNFLRAHGYDRAVSLNGGFLAWTAQP